MPGTRPHRAQVPFVAFCWDVRTFGPMGFPYSTTKSASLLAGEQKATEYLLRMPLGGEKLQVVKVAPEKVLGPL